MTRQEFWAIYLEPWLRNHPTATEFEKKRVEWRLMKLEREGIRKGWVSRDK
jgi:hypothetical protein